MRQTLQSLAALGLLIGIGGTVGCQEKTEQDGMKETDIGFVDKYESVPESVQIEQNLAKLSPDDQELAKVQKICPVAKKPLGHMGVPVKVMAGGHEVLLCCGGCKETIQADPEKYLAVIGLMAEKNAGETVSTK